MALQRRDSNNRRLPLVLRPMVHSYIVARDWDTEFGWKVPMGFQVNAASIPRPFWFLPGSPFVPKMAEAVTLHDYLYRTASADTNREEADRVFHVVMREHDVGRWTARLLWCAVRLFGRGSYDRARAGKERD